MNSLTKLIILIFKLSVLLRNKCFLTVEKFKLLCFWINKTFTENVFLKPDIEHYEAQVELRHWPDLMAWNHTE